VLFASGKPHFTVKASRATLRTSEVTCPCTAVHLAGAHLQLQPALQVHYLPSNQKWRDSEMTQHKVNRAVSSQPQPKNCIADISRTV
jgi:hypothetical protein